MEIKDNKLRPSTLNDFIGQEEVKLKLKIYIDGAKKRHESLDHILFYGPSGVGKTTLANVIANEMNVGIKVLNGASIDKPSEIISALINLNQGDILFIDEIHRLPIFVQEILYSAMEDYFIEVVNYDSNNIPKPVHIDLNSFALIGATTLLGNLTSPLRNRFGIIERLNYYTCKEGSLIIKRLSLLYKLQIDDKCAINIALRTRGIPRLIVNHFKRLRDYLLSKNMNVFSNEIINDYFKLVHIDKIGLNELDYLILKTIAIKLANNPIGIDSLCLMLNEDKKTIEEYNEPYLLRIGFLERTKQGRKVTSKGLEYLKVK